MERKVQIYIEGERLELFNDEKIGVNSTVQNIADISKVFTDFSQSFTVPASPHNNAIFEHFYANEVNGTLNHNIRRDAVIEIDLTTFRTGKIQLEKSEIKNLATDSYTLTFYGEVRTLKDLFAEDKLSQLDYSAYSHEYSGLEILERISGLTTDHDVRWPLISSKRVWQYNEPTTPLDNIDTNTGRIFYNELFPALKVARIFDVIESTYGVTFLGSWLQTNRFQKLFLYLKNSATFENTTPPSRIDYTSVSSTPAEYGFDLTNDLIYYNQPATYTIGTHYIRANVTSVSSTALFYFDIYRNGSLITTVTGNGALGAYNYSLYSFPTNSITNTDEYYIEVRAASTMNIDLEIQEIHSYVDNGSFQTDIVVAQCNTLVLFNDVNLSSSMPDIKLADFFSGILKQFNLTCYPVSSTEFYLEPLEDWYARGIEHDITKYTITDSIEIARLPLYKKISYMYQKAESFMNNAFNRFFNRNYADLEATFNYDGGDFTVQTPFEQILFNKFTGTDIQVGYLLKDAPNYEPYVPKPMLLYYNEMVNINAADFKFDDGAIIWNVGDYALFGQDVLENGNRFSLCWGAEVSSYYDDVIENGIYNTYYSAYMANMYNLKNRLTTVKTVLPLSILTQLKLNDRLIIRDKRYIINEMKTELTSGEVTFTLIHDYRPLRFRSKVKPSIGTTQVTVGTNMKSMSVQGDVDITGTDIISATPSTFTTDTLITFEIPPFGSEVFEIGSEQGDFIVAEDGQTLIINEEGTVELLTATINYTMQDGTIETEYIDISRT